MSVPRLHGNPKRLAEALLALPEGAVVVKNAMGNLWVVTEDRVVTGYIDIYQSKYPDDEIYSSFDPPFKLDEKDY